MITNYYRFISTSFAYQLSMKWFQNVAFINCIHKYFLINFVLPRALLTLEIENLMRFDPFENNLGINWDYISIYGIKF